MVVDVCALFTLWKLVLVEMSLKRASCMSDMPKIKKICSDSSLEIARSTVNTSSRTDEAFLEGNNTLCMPLPPI